VQVSDLKSLVKADHSVEIRATNLSEETLDRIETEIADVKRQYDLFFQGSRRSEPSDQRREVEEKIRRMGQRRIINTNEQFRFHTLQSRFYSLSNLWMRMIRDMEEGRLARE